MKVSMVEVSRSCTEANVAVAHRVMKVNRTTEPVFVIAINLQLSVDSFLQYGIEILYRSLEHFITPFTNSFWRWLDFDVRLNTEALQLAAIGVTHIVTGEVHINPAR